MAKFLDKAGLERLMEHLGVKLGAKQDRLTGSPGQVVGFGEDGAPEAQAALTMDEVNAAIDKAVAEAVGSGGVTVERLEIRTPPSKTQYKPGEAFDPAGMSVWAEFSNGYGMYVDQSELSVSPGGPLAAGLDAVTVGFCWGTQAASARQEIAVCNIYGVSWDGTSTTKLTRTDDAAEFVDPDPAVGVSGAGSSPFDGLLPWSGMKRVTDPAAGELVEIPKFWYKLTQRGAALDIQIADGYKAGFSVSPAHMNRGDGKGERDFVYIGRYHCADGYKSTTDALPVSNITRDGARKGIQALGEGICQSDFAMRFTIWLLYIVEFANWDSQSCIGVGCGNGNANGAQNMGYTDDMAYHTGTTLDKRNYFGFGTQYRWIEGLWDNAYDWLDGCVCDSDGLHLILNPAQFADSVTEADAKLACLPADGYPSALSVTDAGGFPMFYPTASDGSHIFAGPEGETFLQDCWWFVPDYPCLAVGGSYGYYYSSGLFAVFGTAVDAVGKNTGCRLQKLP